MANARFAWGIDVGNRALKAVRLERVGDGSLRVTDFDFIEHPTILSDAGDNRADLIREALQTFVSRKTIKGGVVGLSVSGQSSFARFVKLPPVEAKRIPEIVRFEAIQQIPFPLDDVEWSYQLFQEPDSPDVEVGIFAMRKELVNSHVGRFTDLGMNVQVVQTSPLAVYNAIQHDGRLARGTCMMIDVGAENTDLIIADDHHIWLRSIPIGGNNFTEALTKAFKVDSDKAEELKRTAATSKYARQIFQAMRPVFAELVAEVQRSIGFYASVNKDSRIRKAIALGGTFQLPGLQKYLKQNLQLDVDRIDALSAGAPPENRDLDAFTKNLPSCVGAYGLAIQAMGDAKVNSSLLPQTIRRETLWRDKTKWFAAAAALFVAGTTLPVGRLFFEQTQYRSAAPNLEVVRQVRADAEQLSGQWQQIQGSGQAERQLIRNVATLAQSKNFWPDFVTELHAALPQPPQGLAEAIASGSPEALRRTPRSERALVLLDRWRAQYYPQIAPILASGDFARFATPLDGQAAAGFDPRGGVPAGGFVDPTGEAQALYDADGNPISGEPSPDAVTDTGGGSAIAPDARGFTLTLRLTTPSAEAQELIFGQLQQRLLSVRPDERTPNRRFAIQKVQVVRLGQIRNNPERLQQLATDYQRTAASNAAATGTTRGGFAPPPPGRPGSGSPAPRVGQRGVRPGFGPPPTLTLPGEDPDAPFLDRLTGEDVRDDWEFDVLIGVVVDPPAYVPRQPADEGVDDGTAEPDPAGQTVMAN